jgi:hypothetical protein
MADSPFVKDCLRGSASILVHQALGIKELFADSGGFVLKPGRVGYPAGAVK